MTRRWRSLLFVSAADTARLAKVGGYGADAIILDLEDAVAPSMKPGARRGVAPAAARLSGAGTDVVVRVNAAWRDLAADIPAAVRPGVAAIMVPKAASAARLSVIAEMIAEEAEAAGVAPPPLLALIESPAGLAQCDEIAALPCVAGLAFGTEDFSLALGVAPAPEALDLPCRLIALAAARHGVMALGLPVSIATIQDRPAWIGGVRAARSIGMTGALCIHPQQVESANEGFMPSPLEIVAARKIIIAWNNAGDEAGAVKLEGRMIDLPVVLAARRTLAIANIVED